MATSIRYNEDIIREERLPVQCEKTGKLLARHTRGGLWLWCRDCHCEHFVSWEKIERKESEAT